LPRLVGTAIGLAALNEPVVIEFTPAKTGEIAFACGMNMLHGTVVVQ
jgi:plastocyanin domain-containing protein